LTELKQLRPEALVVRFGVGPLSASLARTGDRHENDHPIAPLDAALVARGDCTFEVWLPHIHSDRRPRRGAMSALVFAVSRQAIMTIRQGRDAMLRATSTSILRRP